MIPSLARNSNQLVDKLVARLADPKEVTEFERKLLIRECEKQVDADREFALKSLVYAIDSQHQEAVESAHKALALYSQEATVTLSLFALQVLGEYTAIKGIFKKYSYLLDEPTYAVSMSHSLAAIPDMYYIDKVIDVLTRTRKSDEVEGLSKMCKCFARHAQLAKEEFGLERDTLGVISDLASTVAETSGNVVINNAAFELSPTGEHMSLVYYVETDFEQLFDLNLSLIDSLIEHNLDRLPLVTRFDLITSDMTPMREFYAR